MLKGSEKDVVFLFFFQRTSVYVFEWRFGVRWLLGKKKHILMYSNFKRPTHRSRRRAEFTIIV
jgi:hypothetical protein